MVFCLQNKFLQNVLINSYRFNELNIIELFCLCRHSRLVKTREIFSGPCHVNFFFFAVNLSIWPEHKCSIKIWENVEIGKYDFENIVLFSWWRKLSQNSDLKTIAKLMLSFHLYKLPATKFVLAHQFSCYVTNR